MHSSFLNDYIFPHFFQMIQRLEGYQEAFRSPRGENHDDDYDDTDIEEKPARPI